MPISLARGIVRALHPAFHHRRLVLAAMLVAVSAAAAASWLVAPVYRAEGRVTVAALSPEVKQAADLRPALDEVAAVQIALLADERSHQRVIAAIGRDRLFPDQTPDHDARRFAQALTVAQDDGRGLVLTFDHADPAVAVETLAAVVATWRERRDQALKDNAAPVSETIAAAQTRLQAAKDRLAAYRKDHRLYAPEEQRAALLRQRITLDGEFKMTQAQARELQGKVAALRAQLRATPRTLARKADPERSSAAAEARAKLLELQLREQQLSAKYTEHSQMLANVRNELRLVKAFVADLDSTAAVNSLYHELEDEIARTDGALTLARSRVPVLADQLAEVEAKLDALGAAERGLRELADAVDAATAEHRIATANDEERRTSREMERAAIGVIESVRIAPPPKRPVRPQPVVYLLIALAGGAVAGWAVALAAEAASRRFATAHAAEKRLDVPVLTTVGLG